MLASHRFFRTQLRAIISCKEEQGHDVTGLLEELENMKDSYDGFSGLAKRLTQLPMRPDWKYVEPNDLEEIWKECDKTRPESIGNTDPDEACKRVEAAFLGSVCGCILGKPLEINPTLDEIRKALEKIGEWPIDNYISIKATKAFDRKLNPSWKETVREKIKYVAADDDINYTIMGMMILQNHGPDFSTKNVRDLWIKNLPIGYTFGPERLILLKAGLNTLDGGDPEDLGSWVTIFNPFDEYCGALIRADAYGYACPGQPALAAELAWRDSRLTHRRTGIYGAMFMAAAVAASIVERDRLGIFETALKFVPKHSRFYKIVSDSIGEVKHASDWLDGYHRIHSKYKEYAHCRVYQEVGTLINTLQFAENVGDGICKQVSQGNDTDSFGARAGSLLGAYFGPGHLEERWLTPFNDDIHTSLACFYERSLSKLTKQMGKLPTVIEKRAKK